MKQSGTGFLNSLGMNPALKGEIATLRENQTEKFLNTKRELTLDS
jgi:hypothetical protein